MVTKIWPGLCRTSPSPPGADSLRRFIWSTTPQLLLFSHSVVFNSLQPHGPHARLPCLHCLLDFAQIHIYWVNDAIQPSHPLSSPSPPALSLSQCQVFSSESVLRLRWPKYWSFTFSISLSNDHSGLISFRIDWLDLLAIQRTLKSLLQKGRISCQT